MVKTKALYYLMVLYDKSLSLAFISLTPSLNIMKKIKPLFNLITFVFLFVISIANAQKLPKVQQASLLAPANIKIDGKLDEWLQFQAYNPTSRIFYTVANDDNNMYLALRTDGDGAHVKAISGGITFTITNAVKSKEAKQVSITYPAVVSQQNSMHETLQGSTRRYKNLKNDSETNEKLSAFIKLTNQQLVSFFKEIKVSGIDEISDPTISIYNAEGIKAVVSFNDKMEYCYELSIPIKFINKTLTGSKLRYNIKSNARGTISVRGVPGAPIYTGNDAETLYKNNTTDFWGEYVLANKQPIK